ncbi:MAG: PHP domain-containing protein [Planctomycetota bacterium]|nr:PHP domain-containing protein [Planctomycetota bacterium]
MLVSGDFVHLCVHSNYSLLEGASSPAELLAGAKASGMRALALTDTNALYGVPLFYKLAREIGIKPIIGCVVEIALKTAPFCLLARNLDGYANLCRIVTERRLTPDFSIERALEQYGDNLYVLCRDTARLMALQGIVEPQRLYLQVSAPGRIEKSLLAKGDSGGCLSPPAVREFPLSKVAPTAAGVAAAALRFRGLSVAAFDVRYAKPQQRTLLHLLLAMKNGRLLSEQAKETPAEMTHLKSAEEVREIFGPVSGPVENAARIAADCNVEFRSGTPIFPKSWAVGTYASPAPSRDRRGPPRARRDQCRARRDQCRDRKGAVEQISDPGFRIDHRQLQNPQSEITNPPPAIQNLKSKLQNRQSAIRIGLAEVKGLSQRTVLVILRERERGRFSSLADFLARVRCVTQPEVENLILCGAMESFGLTRPQLMRQWRLLEKLQVAGFKLRETFSLPTRNLQPATDNPKFEIKTVGNSSCLLQLRNLKSKI